MRKVYLISKGNLYKGNWTFMLDTAFTSRKARERYSNNILDINQAENINTVQSDWESRFGCEADTYIYYDGENYKYKGCIKLHELVLNQG